MMELLNQMAPRAAMTDELEAGLIEERFLEG
jgi:hypothetical protein